MERYLCKDEEREWEGGREKGIIKQCRIQALFTQVFFLTVEEADFD
jgi:hypothetical protein